MTLAQRIISAVCALLLAGVALTSATGQEVQRVAVLVNDEPISLYDINQRLAFAVATTGGVQSEEQFARLRSRVVNQLVDEKLQIQEANEMEVPVDDAEVEDFFANWADAFNQNPDEFAAFLRQMGTSKDALTNQIRAQIVWERLVSGRFRNQAAVGDGEVEEVLDRLEDNAGQFEYRLSEILLIVDNPRRENDIREVAMGIYNQLENGANFQTLASQFSQSATAAAGGDLGWLAESQMSEDLVSAVKGLNVGQYSRPIRSAGGFYIVQLRDRRRILSVDPLDVQLRLRQVYLPFEGLSQERATQLLDRAATAASEVDGCSASLGSQIAALGEEFQSGELGLLRLRDMTGQLRGALEDLDVGEASEAIVTNDGMRIFYVCEKIEPELQKPSFDQVQRRLEGQRLAMMGRRYLRDLRRDAIIDYRVEMDDSEGQ